MIPRADKGQGVSSPLIPTPAVDQFAPNLPSLLEVKGPRRTSSVIWKQSSAPKGMLGRARHIIYQNNFPQAPLCLIQAEELVALGTCHSTVQPCFTAPVPPRSPGGTSGLMSVNRGEEEEEEVELAWMLLHGECHPLKKSPPVEWWQLLLWP